MPKISELIKPHFDQSVRGKGLAYYLKGAAHILKKSENDVTLSVSGTRDYAVTLSLSGSTCSVSCNCPYFSPGHTPCKHIWASQLQAESASCFRSYEGPELIFKPIDSKTPLSDKKDDVDIDYTALENEFVKAIKREVRPDKKVLEPQWRQQPKFPEWEELLRVTASIQKEDVRQKQPINGEIIYILYPMRTIDSDTMAIEIMQRKKNAMGEWLKPKRASLTAEHLNSIEGPVDRRLICQIFGMNTFSEYSYRNTWSEAIVPIKLQHQLVPELLSTGRFFLGMRDDDLIGPMQFDSAGPWELHLQISPMKNSKDYIFSGSFFRANVYKNIDECMMATARGFVFFKDLSVAHLEDFGCFHLLARLRAQDGIQVPGQQIEKFMESYYGLGKRAPISVPPALQFEELHITPVPILQVRQPDPYREKGMFVGEVQFNYNDILVDPESKTGSVIFKKKRQVIVRNTDAETSAYKFLYELGFVEAGRSVYQRMMTKSLSFPKKPFVQVVSTLLDAKWIVEGEEGVLFRKSGGVSLSVTSGIDWFDLTAACDYNGQTVTLPQLLTTLKKGERFIKLDDGTMGMLPEEWLNKYSHVVKMGRVEGDTIRFKNSQALIVDMLLQDQPEVNCDATFKKIRDELGGFTGIASAQPPQGFGGELRPYQSEGLGWLLFLQKFGLGGCLADDMGLGKTVQVLALLMLRLQKNNPQTANTTKRKPILIVVPRSLIFNWQREAAHFTPQLRICDFSHAARGESVDALYENDAVLVTYGTLRRDITRLKDIEFDYAILDEAQAIKNATTITAKAVRLIKADHRLVLSGTPIENHLGELWGLFEFLNPGILGASSIFKDSANTLKRPDDQTLEILRRGLRPFILRRTKAQVATDLPKKLEDTLICEMKPAQRKLYDELKEHYRSSLLAQVKKDGINKVKIQILEALLRLRQAACHPGLIDKKRMSEGSAKLDTLLAQLDEVTQEGHKALVFSQFTSMLSIVRSRLDKAGVVYEYLDGKTHDRQACVDRFQSDTSCSLFLISLKAGGVGLNLTAAEYVFLLDPWWNPAVEAQAIDRTHRIGQKNPVFAYRLICKDTVEEKVLELQKSKRELAESIITADNSMIRGMKAEDLELLLT